MFVLLQQTNMYFKRTTSIGWILIVVNTGVFVPNKPSCRFSMSEWHVQQLMIHTVTYMIALPNRWGLWLMPRSSSFMKATSSKNTATVPNCWSPEQPLISPGRSPRVLGQPEHPSVVIP
jgi:hypothetical protein